MSGAIASKRFSDEFASLLDRVVKAVTSTGAYTGRVLAYNPSDYSLWLADARDEQGNIYSKVFLSGHSIARVEMVEKGPDLSQLVERLNRLFPNLVTYLKESDTIVVMDRIRISREGVVGEGPVAERVRKVYEDFMKEMQAKKL